MIDYTDEELFNIIKSTIIKSNLGLSVTNDKAVLVEDIARKNSELYNLAVDAALIEINKQKENNSRNDFTYIENIRIFAEEAKIETNGVKRISETESYEFLRTLNTNQNIISFVVSGDSMINAGINNGDLLFAESGIELHNGDIVIVEVNSETYVKRLKISGDTVWLFSENPHYEPVKIKSSMKVQFKGRVKAGLRLY